MSTKTGNECYILLATGGVLHDSIFLDRERCHGNYAGVWVCSLLPRCYEELFLLEVSLEDLT